ncbi:MFS general substrate transporter [Paxillus ammoniavirescens]|nr:MFS general substrate transporter [Paxillus ammoniavirescens]
MSLDLERTPLLENHDAPLGNNLHVGVRDQGSTEDVYSRFNARQRRSILFLVAFAGLITMLVWKSFVPSIPQVATDLNSDEATVSLAVSLSVLSSATSAVFWAAQSSVYGRRIIFLWGIPVLCVGSIGVAMCTSVASLFFWRVVQAVGCAGRLALACGIVGDTHPLEERGGAMGLFFGIVLLGTIAAPTIGGAFTTYASWRDLHLVIAAWGCVEFIVIYLSLPETSHSHSVHNKGQAPARPRFLFVNPLTSLRLLRSPNLLLANVVAGIGMVTEFILLVPIAHTLGKQYNITSEAAIGACFIPHSVGSFLGAPMAGRLSDVMVQMGRRQREGKWVPEDRLRAIYIGGLILAPLSLVGFGFVTTYVEGTLGLVISLILLFINGFGIDFVVNPVNAYTVDLVHSQGAEVMAVGGAFRSIIMATGIALVLPSIQHFGVLTTNIFTAFLMLAGQGLVYLIIKFGDRMRAYIDVGYTTANNL